MLRTVCIAALVGTFGSTALAQDADGVKQASFLFNGEERTISQGSAVDPALIASFYTLPHCAGLCLAPQEASKGVATISEIDVIDFMANSVASGEGILIDARVPTDRLKGYLPASVSVPFTLINETNPYLRDILEVLGWRGAGDTLNFADAIPIVVFDAGPTTLDAAKFINGLVDLGYPSSKISYYRGGMQTWSAVGLTVEGMPS